MKLLEYKNDPARFQADIHIPTGSGSRRFGDIAAPFQAERFGVANPALIAVLKGEQPPFAGLWDERTKGASKDSDHAVNLLWLLAFSQRALRIEIGAGDQKQADEIRLIVKGILRIDKPLNRFLDQVINVQTDKIVNTRTDAQADILTTDKLGSHGSRPDLVLLNELTHQQDDGFASTLLDNADKMPNSLTIIATNSGHLETWQQTWKQTFSESARWRVLEYNEPAPWISQAALAESEKRNPISRFLRLWRGIWASPGGDALPTDVIQQAFKSNLKPTHRPDPNYEYVAGCDLGLTRDRSAAVLLGIHKETKQIRLCQTCVWHPPKGGKVSLIEVELHLLKWNDEYKLREANLDPWQAALLCQRLQQADVEVRETSFTPANLQAMASTTLECFNDRQVDLYPHDDLRRDLLKAALVEKGYGFRIEFPSDAKTGHCDLGQAFVLALLSAKEVAGDTRRVARLLISYNNDRQPDLTYFEKRQREYAERQRKRQERREREARGEIDFVPLPLDVDLDEYGDPQRRYLD